MFRSFFRPAARQEQRNDVGVVADELFGALIGARHGNAHSVGQVVGGGRELVPTIEEERDGGIVLVVAEPAAVDPVAHLDHVALQVPSYVRVARRGRGNDTTVNVADRTADLVAVAEEVVDSAISSAASSAFKMM